MSKRRKIIAIDFDGTLCKSNYPNLGPPIEETLQAIKEEQKNGARLILWTCRAGQALKDAIKWCEEQGLKFEAVNENLPDILEVFDSDGRKIFANEYWDDKAYNPNSEIDSENDFYIEDENPFIFCRQCNKTAITAYGLYCLDEDSPYAGFVGANDGCTLGKPKPKEKIKNRWIYSGNYIRPWYCGNCSRPSEYRTNYCPDCGIKMED